jgi:hypothetical protein
MSAGLLQAADACLLLEVDAAAAGPKQLLLLLLGTLSGFFLGVRWHVTQSCDQ